MRETADLFDEEVEPRAGSLVESLRAFGYSPEAALADLIDNSITARAANVWLDFFWNGSESDVVILDDGRGMVETELREAMRPGTTSPLDARALGDLGRFGLGLKTASFSQCRRLTVRSKAIGGNCSTRCWDLDHVGAVGRWRLLTTAYGETERRLSRLDKLDRGTVVVWEKPDRLAGRTDADDQKAHRRFLAMIDRVETHLSMVFHRYLSGPRRRLRIWINDREVTAWDPFLVDQGSEVLPSERITLRQDSMLISPYVLPHRSRLSMEAQKNGAGPSGWNAQQGFYVYRGDRLLVAGSWLGLPYTKEEHYKLARIAVDLPTTMDHDWDINVTKSKAVPPGVLREDLKRIAGYTRERAVSVFRHRGRLDVGPATQQPWVYMWSRREAGGRISYRINRQHTLIELLRFQLEGESRDHLERLLRLIEETVPVPAIALDASHRPDDQSQPFDRAAAGEVLEVMRSIYTALLGQGLTAKVAVDRVAAMEPFNAFPELVQVLRESQPKVS